MDKKKIFKLLGVYAVYAIIAVIGFANHCHKFPIYDYGMPQPCNDCSKEPDPNLSGFLYWEQMTNCCGASITECGFGAILANFHILPDEVATNVSSLSLVSIILLLLSIILLPIGIIYKKKWLIIISIILAIIPIIQIIHAVSGAISTTNYYRSLPV